MESKKKIANKSFCPEGNPYFIPDNSDLKREFAQLCKDCENARKAGSQITVVVGLGFVGSAVAAVLSGARSSGNVPTHMVIGLDLASAEAFWKIGKMNAGKAPFESPDPEISHLIAAGVKQGNLVATATKDVLTLADTIVVDIHLDVVDIADENPENIDIRIDGFRQTLVEIGSQMGEDALVVLESTVPPGTTISIAKNALEEARKARGLKGALLLGHAYERVMPGSNYAKSIDQIWRTYSGINKMSRERTRIFLESFVNTASFPLQELKSPTASELAKTLENSYRAANIALIHEWALLAEYLGVNLFEIVDSVRVRKGTHDNMRYPGFGVGGYCLTKDALLAQWAATNLFGLDHRLTLTLQALQINYHMPSHSLDLVLDLSGGSIDGKRISLLGIAYMPGVGDSRNSPAEYFADHAMSRGAKVIAHDPYISRWEARPEIPLMKSFDDTLSEADCIVLAVRHPEYEGLCVEDFGEGEGRGIVDAWNVITDELAAKLHSKGWRIKGVGKGHWGALNYQNG